MSRDPTEARRSMVRYLRARGLVRDERLARAMEEVPRHLFVPPSYGDAAYVDEPLAIGLGQTISAPHMVAMMLEALDPRPGEKVLEVGSGSGYHAALAAALVSPGGRVISLERIPELAAAARRNLQAAGVRNVEVIETDGTRGWPAGAPYDGIMVTAASPAVPPPLPEQLAPGGRLVIPVGSQYTQELMRGVKTPRGLRWDNLGGCAFVPLVGEFGFRARGGAA